MRAFNSAARAIQSLSSTVVRRVWRAGRKPPTMNALRHRRAKHDRPRAPSVPSSIWLGCTGTKSRSTEALVFAGGEGVCRWKTAVGAKCTKTTSVSYGELRRASGIGQGEHHGLGSAEIRISCICCEEVGIQDLETTRSIDEFARRLQDGLRNGRSEGPPDGAPATPGWGA